ncbi:MAG TPA: hypothetical protein VJ828_07350 [Lacipirellulaceae bacterium]|nr:hypothetical protein [Lacipirellulaceae bacterium]
MAELYRFFSSGGRPPDDDTQRDTATSYMLRIGAAQGEHHFSFGRFAALSAPRA